MLIELALEAVKDDLRKEGVPVDPPTYTIDLAGGVAEEIEHIYDPENKLDTLTIPGDAAQTAVNFVRWRRYLAGLSRLAEAQEDCRLHEFFTQGVEFDWPEGIDGWEEQLRRKSRGRVTPPEDDGTPETDAERKWFWLWFSHLSSYDIQAIRAILNVLAQGKLLSKEQFREVTDAIRSGMVNLIWQALEPIIKSNQPAVETGAPVVPDA